MPKARRREMSLFLVREDSAALEAALLAAFPRVACYSEEVSFRRPIAFHRSLPGCANGTYYVIAPEQGWQPLLKPGRWEDGFVGLARRPRLECYLRLAHEPYRREAKDRPGQAGWELMDSNLVTLAAAGDEAQGAFAKRLSEILRALSTPDLARVDPRTREPVAPAAPVASHRAGHHAIAWCRADARRTLGCMTATFRPAP